MLFGMLNFGTIVTSLMTAHVSGHHAHGEESVAARAQIEDDIKPTKTTGLLKNCGFQTGGHV